MILFIDTETYSPIPIKHGEYKYAEKAEVLILSYAFDREQPTVLDWDKYCPELMDTLMEQADRIVIHKAEFDRTVLRQEGVEVPLEKIYCTVAQARRHGLPGALETVCELLKLPYDKAKDKDGKRYINLFCKPNKDGTRNTRETHPVEWAGFRRYAGQDIVAMREAYHRLPKWNDAHELPFWRLDHIINQRGFQVDIDLAQRMIALVDADKARLKGKTRAATGGAVESATQRDKLLGYILAEYGVDLPDMTADTLERRLKDESLPDEVKELIKIRLESSRSSTAKYRRVLECVNSDGRIRATKVCNGALRTGRYSGQKFQPDNMPRPRLPQAFINLGIEAIKASPTGRIPQKRSIFDLVRIAPVSTYAADIIRGLMIAPEGKVLLVSDLSAIEGRTTPWLAYDEKTLADFENQDRGGPDVYMLTYARFFGIPYDEVTPFQRQVGKVIVLMLGYGGGVGAFITGAATYRIDLEELVRAAWPHFSKKLKDEAHGYWDWAVKKGRTLDLPQDIFMTCWCLVQLYRRTHPKIVQMWSDLETAMIDVVHGAKPQTVGRLVVDKTGNWLRIKLPSGRYLSYPSIRYQKGKLSFYGINPYTKKMGRQHIWGGIAFENASQGVAADQLKEGLKRMEEDTDVDPVMHVHDEGIGEADEGTDPGIMDQCLCVRTWWNKGLPLAAKSFATYRYYKG